MECFCCAPSCSLVSLPYTTLLEIRTPQPLIAPACCGEEKGRKRVDDDVTILGPTSPASRSSGNRRGTLASLGSMYYESTATMYRNVLPGEERVTDAVLSKRTHSAVSYSGVQSVK